MFHNLYQNGYIYTYYYIDTYTFKFVHCRVSILETCLKGQCIKLKKLGSSTHYPSITLRFFIALKKKKNFKKYKDFVPRFQLNQIILNKLSPISAKHDP